MVENQAIGLSRGGRTTKIHALVDGLGNPLGFRLTGGQVHDSQVASELLEGFDISQSNIIADKAYGTAKLASILKIKQASIPFRQRKIPKTSGPVITTFIVSAI